MNNNLKKFFLFTNFSIKKSLKIINLSGSGTALVVNKKNQLLGTLSDGDIRRAVIRNFDFNNSIKNIYNKNPTFFYDENVDTDQLKNIFLDLKLEIIPIVDKNKIVKELIFWTDVVDDKKKKKNYQTLKNIPLVIMAGGSGTRMQPYSYILPKTLFPINNKSIVEHIIEKFKNFELKEIFFSINKNDNLLETYFKSKKNDIKIKFVRENKPLGTSGSLALMKKYIKNEIFLVSNCDVIANLDLNKIIKFHKSNKSTLTLIAAKKHLKIPYASLEVDDKNHFKGLKEKPSYKYIVNIGVYVCSKKVFEYININKPMNMTDLISKLNNSKHNVVIYEIDDHQWIDTGQISEFKKALKDIDKI